MRGREGGNMGEGWKEGSDVNEVWNDEGGSNERIKEI